MHRNRSLIHLLVLVVAIAGTGVSQALAQDAARRRKLGLPEPTVTLKVGEVPVASIEKPTLDFGRVMEGKVIEHDFWIKNTGNGPLEILKVKPSCGCTTSGKHDRVIQPGQRGRIPIKIDTKNLMGNVTKNVTVYTNVPGDKNRSALHLKGSVWHPVEVTPRKTSFGKVPEAQIAIEPLSTKVTLVNHMEAPMRLTNLRSTSETFNVEAKAIDAGRKYELIVTATTSFKIGANAGRIEAETGIPEKPQISIPVSLFATATVEVSPASLALPDGRKRVLRRNVYVKNHSGAPITISDLKVSSPKIKASFVETRPGEIFMVMLEFPPDYVPSKSDTITIKTSYEKTPVLTVPIVEHRFRKS